MKLPEPPLLRTLVPEHGTDAVKFLHRVGLIGLVLDVGPHHRGSGLGPQGEASTFDIVEGVHLLGYDVGLLPNAAAEEFGLLKNWGPDLLKAKVLEYASRLGLDPSPDACLFRKNVSESFDAGNFQWLYILSFDVVQRSSGCRLLWLLGFVDFAGVVPRRQASKTRSRRSEVRGQKDIIPQFLNPLIPQFSSSPHQRPDPIPP